MALQHRLSPLPNRKRSPPCHACPLVQAAPQLGLGVAEDADWVRPGLARLARALGPGPVAPAAYGDAGRAPAAASFRSLALSMAVFEYYRPFSQPSWVQDCVLAARQLRGSCSDEELLLLLVAAAQIGVGGAPAGSGAGTRSRRPGSRRRGGEGVDAAAAGSRGTTAAAAAAVVAEQRDALPDDAAAAGAAAALPAGAEAGSDPLAGGGGAGEASAAAAERQAAVGAALEELVARARARLQSERLQLTALARLVRMLEAGSKPGQPEWYQQLLALGKRSMAAKSTARV